MTRVDLTKAQCAELANYLRGILNNGMGAGVRRGIWRLGYGFCTRDDDR
nr:MAG TPA: hypothetical protein [Caudoviricetes sp.]